MRPIGKVFGRNTRGRSVSICRIGEGSAEEAARSFPGARVVNLDTRSLGEQGIARELGEKERGEPVELKIGRAHV